LFLAGVLFFFSDKCLFVFSWCSFFFLLVWVTVHKLLTSIEQKTVNKASFS